MLYIPGLGYIPLASLGNIPGLNLAGRGGPGGPGGAPAAPPTNEGERAWRGLEEMPAVTQETIADLAGALAKEGRSELTVLLLGRGGAGKSSTANSLLNERAANVLAFQADAGRPMAFTRRAAALGGFALTVIDTPSVLEQDAVSDARLEAIARAVGERPIDAVLYVDRADAYAVDGVDLAAIAGLTRVLGPAVWSNAVLTLTRASEAAAPPGVAFEAHAAARAAALRAAVAAAVGAAPGGPGAPELPLALVENASGCPVNDDGEKLVPGDAPWVAELFERLVDVAINAEPFRLRPAAAARAADPNRRRKWLIPLAIAAQVAVKLLLDRVMEDDACRGDANGPFDALTVAERRAEAAAERARARRRRAKARGAARAAPAPAAAAAYGDDGGGFEAGEEEEEEEEEEWEE
jgi:hypothetical protein